MNERLDRFTLLVKQINSRRGRHETGKSSKKDSAASLSEWRRRAAVRPVEDNQAHQEGIQGKKGGPR